MRIRKDRAAALLWASQWSVVACPCCPVGWVEQVSYEDVVGVDPAWPRLVVVAAWASCWCPSCNAGFDIGYEDRDGCPRTPVRFRAFGGDERRFPWRD